MNSPAVQPASAPSTGRRYCVPQRIHCAVLREAQAREWRLGVRATDIKARSLAYDMPGSGPFFITLACETDGRLVWAWLLNLGCVSNRWRAGLGNAPPDPLSAWPFMLELACLQPFQYLEACARSAADFTWPLAYPVGDLFFSGWCLESLETGTCCEI